MDNKARCRSSCTVVFLSALHLLVIVSTADCRDFNIGFLPSMKAGEGRKYAGAFVYAIQKVNSGQMMDDDGRTALLTSLNKDHRLVYKYTDVRGDTLLAIREMTKQYINQTIAFIGPEDTCYFEAKIAAAWNLPMIAYKCTDYRISEKESFPTFARTLAPTSKVSKSIIAVLNRYKWKRFTTIASKTIKWQETARTLIDLAKRMDPPLEPKDIRTYDPVFYKKGNVPDIKAKKTTVPDGFEKFGVHLNNDGNWTNWDNWTRPLSMSLNSDPTMARIRDEPKLDFQRFSKELKVDSPLLEAYGIPKRFDETLVSAVRKKLNEMIEETKSETRIYVFLGERSELVHFVRELDRRVDRREYVVLAVDDGAQEFNMLHFEERPDKDWPPEEAVLSFRMVLIITPSSPHREQYNYQEFLQGSRNLSHTEFNVQKVPVLDEVPLDERYAVAVYDAVYIYTRALHDVLSSGDDPQNGSAIFQRIRGSTFNSISGHSVRIDDNADAEGNFSVLALKQDPSAKSTHFWRFSLVGIVEKTKPDDSFKLTDKIDWILGEPPRDEPECGFKGDKCPDTTNWAIITIVTGAVVILFVGTVFGIRHYLYEQKLASLLWKIDYKDILVSTMDETAAQSGRMKRKIYPQYSFLSTSPSEDQLDSKPARQTSYCEVGSYKGQVVAIKRLKKKQVELNRVIKKELQLMKEMNHDNINRFVGAVVDPNHICIITHYCTRGSLQDILQKEDINYLDEMFKASLINDLIKGMMFLHDSEIISHGKLKSSNCLVDIRWVLQISGFGLTNFKVPDPSLEYPNGEEAYRDLLWTAPELLRDSNPPRYGTQKGDVYSFAIILHEIMARLGPWGDTELTSREIVRKVRAMPEDGVLFRPNVKHCDDDQKIVLDCMEGCWSEDPEDRPEFKLIRVRLKDLYKGLRSNIFDNMVALMEKYSSTLENQVEERTQQLSEEKKKTEALLHRMLPKSVAEQLKMGVAVEPEHYGHVTIYFSDIVGFTAMAARTTPLEVVNLLNKLYSLFDNIIGNYDVYKVETIGDAYMVVSGLPIRNGDDHAGEIASMSLYLLYAIKNFNMDGQHTEPIKLRIGIHSGPCVAGVVGHKMPRYCLFGDTVNTSSRMESTGVALKIHCSEQCKQFLDKLGGYKLVERGRIEVKGKGLLTTYFLEGENTSHRLRRISREKPACYVQHAQMTEQRLKLLSTSVDSLLSTSIDEHEKLIQPQSLHALDSSFRNDTTYINENDTTYINENDTTINSCRPLLNNSFLNMKSTGSLTDKDNCMSIPLLHNGKSNRDEDEYHDICRQASKEFMV